MSRFLITTSNTRAAQFYFHELKNNSAFVDELRGSFTLKETSKSIQAVFSVDFPSNARYLLYVALFLCMPSIFAYVAGFYSVSVAGFVFAGFILLVYGYVSTPIAFYHSVLRGLKSVGHKDKVFIRWSVE